MVNFYSGVAGRRPGKPTFAIIHNDAGSINATASYYSHWLPTHQAIPTNVISVALILKYCVILIFAKKYSSVSLL